MSRLLFLFDESSSTTPTTTPRVFDSGLPAPIRTLIRNAVLAKLAPLAAAPNGAGFLEAIIPIGFPVEKHDDQSIDMLWEELGARTPAVAVACLEQIFKPAGAPDRSLGTLKVDVYIVTSHRRGMTDGRTSSDLSSTSSNDADPGIDTALEFVWQFLNDTDLAINNKTTPIICVREDPLVSDHEKSIWRQEWIVQLQRDVKLNRAVKQKLISMHTTLKPVGDEPVAKHMVEDTTVG